MLWQASLYRPGFLDIRDIGNIGISPTSETHKDLHCGHCKADQTLEPHSADHSAISARLAIGALEERAHCTAESDPSPLRWGDLAL